MGIHEFGSKIRYSEPFEPKNDSVSMKNESRFNFLYSQAFQEVKKKISHKEENLPFLKLKSYDNPNYHSQKTKNYPPISQRSQRLMPNPLIRHKSINTISVRYSASPKKHSVNKILWEKKISLETLRISSTKRLSKNTLSKDLQKDSLKQFRQKTSIESKDVGYDEEYNFYSHMSITPLNIVSSKEERQKYLSNKKKVEDKFKITFYNDKEKNFDKKVLLEPKNDCLFKNNIWQVERDEDEFINFVKQKTTTTNHN